MNFITERLLVAQITKEDLPDLHNMNANEDVARYNTIGIPKDFTTTEKLFESFFKDKNNPEQSSFAWTVKLKSTGEFIGELGMNLGPKRYKSSEIFYNLLPEYWGNGYAVEATEGLLQFCFDDLKLHRVSAGVAVENTRSIKLLEKLGMKLEGRHRAVLPLSSGWSDNYTYAVLSADYQLD